MCTGVGKLAARIGSCRFAFYFGRPFFLDRRKSHHSLGWVCPHPADIYISLFFFFFSRVFPQRSFPTQEGGSVFEDTDISKMLGGKAAKTASGGKSGAPW